MSDTGHTKCPRCGKELTASAPEGLCPACLAGLNFATETNLSGADMKDALPPMTPAELAPHFPQLEILECLGRGGMGVVYKARQKSLNRMVALKLMAPERVQDGKFAARFEKEAQALAVLNHPNIVTVHDFGQAGGFYFLLMEFVDGVNLRQLLRSRKLQPAEALAIVPPICEALQYAHEHGIVHRDIKPENLLLAKDGRVKIADFGIAKILGNPADKDEKAEDKAAADGATQHTTMGTPQYMAPEQREHPQTADHRADIYSLGVVLYELLTGELPADKLQPPSRKVQIDVRLDEVVLRALEKTPELRYQTAGEFKTRVETVTAGNSPSSSKHPTLIKQARGRYTSPEYLATPGGGFLKHEGKGELSLYSDHLIFAASGKRTRIPFDSLRQLAAARGPRWTSPAGHQYLSLIYDDGSRKRHLLFMAGEGIFKTAADTEDDAADWIAAIQAAVLENGGKALIVPEGGPLVVAASPGLTAFILLPFFVLAVFAWLLPLMPGPRPGSGHDSNRWVHLGPLLALLAGAGAALLFFSRRTRRTSGKGKVNGSQARGNASEAGTASTPPAGLAKERASRNTSVGNHAGKVIFYVSVILGVLLIGMLPFRFNRDSAYLLLVGVSLMFSIFAGVMMERRWRRAITSQDLNSIELWQARFKALSVVAWILSLPVIGFGIFFLVNVLSEKGGWNPAVSEAVLVPLTWLGMLFLPWAGARLSRVESNPPEKSRGSGGGGAFVLRLVIFLVFIAVFVNVASKTREHAETDWREAQKQKLAQAMWSPMSERKINEPPFIAHLPDGRRLELLAVRLPKTDKSEAWWKPDGSPSIYGGDVQMEGTLTSSNGVLGLVRIEPRFQTLSDNMASFPDGYRMVLKNGVRQPTGELSVMHFDRVVGDGETASLFVRVGVRDWDTLLVMEAGVGGYLKGGAARRQWEFSETSNGNLKVSTKNLMKQEGMEYSLVAIGKDGKTYRPNLIQETKATGKAWSEYEAGFDSGGMTDALKLSEVKEVRWRARTLDTVEFRNVSLKQGRITQVEVRDLGTDLRTREEAVRRDADNTKVLLGTASLIQAKADGLSWRWRVNKQRSARLLFGLTDSDLNGVLGTIVPVSLRENEVVNGDWSVEKDILLTTIKTGDSSQVKLEEKSISPLARFQQAASVGTTLESWQQITSQTQPITLSSTYYQTLWEAEVVRFSADGKTRSPRRLRVVVRLADPDEAENIEVLQDSDPVKEVRAIENKGIVSMGQAMDTASKSIALRSVTNSSGAISLMSRTALLPGEILQPVLRFEDGRLEPGSVTYFVIKRERSDYDTLSLTWQPFPGLAPELELAAVEQIRERWTSNNIILPPGQASRVFTVTNAEGVLIHGEVNFKRSHSVVGETNAAASLVFEKTSGFGQSLMLHFYNGSIPEGYKLVANGVIPESLSGDTHTHVSKGIHGQMGTFSWSLRPRRSLTRDELLQRGGFMGAGGFAEEAARQINNRGAKGPIVVRPGKPIELFSVTNSAGEVFKGSLELVGNKP
ncbi:MAG TPA: bifunctional serine/threonine protein kinase/MFS transporter [Verrucomicrobiae bacterium]